MESLSIKKTGKVLLAVALVIFMLVALLGLSIYGHTVAAASAEGPDLVITAAFTAESHEAHSDSTSTKRFYNQNSEGAYYLVPNTDTFTVTYSFTVNSAVFTGAKALTLTNAGFDIVSVTVGSTNLTTDEDHSDTVNGVVYTMSADGKSVIGFDGNGNIVSSVSNVVVVYKLNSAIATYENKTIGLSGQYSVLGKKLQNVASNTVAVYVRSTASITTTSPAKTYDATEVSTSTTFTPAVSDSGNESRRSAIVTTWSAGSAPIDAGDYNVAVATAANDYYEATAYNTNFTISPKAITITADNKTSVYSTSPVALSYTPSPIDFYDRDSVTVTYTGAGASISTATTVGSYTITPVASNANYTITPVNGTYTVTRHHVAVPTVTIYNNGATTDTTITAGTTEEKTFNGKAYTFNYTAASADANSIVPFTAAGGDAITNVGSSTLTLSVNANYYWGAEGVAVGSQDTDAKTFTIQVNKANITVTLHHDAIEYLDAVPTTGYSITAAPCLFDEDVSTVVINQADFSTTYNVGSGVGTYDIAIANTNGSKTAIEAYLSNYNVSYTGEDQLTVGKKTINVAANWIAWDDDDSDTMTYDATAHGIVAVPANYTYASTAICNVAFSGGDNSNGTQTHVTATAGNDPAPVTLTATFTLKGDSAKDNYDNVITANYNLVTNTTSKDITITRKALSITANPKTITYGDAFANDGVAYSGFADGEDETDLSGTLAYATDYVAEALNAKRVVGTYYIRPSGLSNNDYDITYVDGTLTVSKKTVSITWSATKSWVYDATSHTITAEIGDTEYSESITVTVYGDDASGTNVGNYTRSVTTLSDMANYALPADVDEDYSITAKPITVTVAAPSGLIYNSNAQTVFTVTVAGLIGDEDLTFAYTNTNLTGSSFNSANGTTNFSGELAQGYAILVTAISDGDTGLAANYSFTADAESTTNSIAKYTFTVGDITYSGATATWVAPTTIQDGDSITFAYSLKLGGVEKLASDTALTYTASATGVYTLSVSFTGDRAANYNAIADRTLLEVFSVTLADTSYNNATYGHPHNGEQIASVTQYAFDGQTVPGVEDWAVAGYDFKGWYVDATDRTSAKFSASNAVTATVTYVASWDVVTYNVTYKYKLSSADSWTTWKSDVVTTYYTALETVPSNKWFSNVGWNDAEAMNGNTKTILDYTSDRTYYTVYTFSVKNGDVDGSGSVTAADATFYRQRNVGGYAISSHILADIDAAWAVTAMSEYAFVIPADGTYFLQPVSDVDASGEEDTNDIFYIVNAQVGKAYADLEDGAVIIKIQSVEDDTTITGIYRTPSAVKVEGSTAAYTYADDTVTLTTALTSGQKLEIIIDRVKFVYTAA